MVQEGEPATIPAAPTPGEAPQARLLTSSAGMAVGTLLSRLTGFVRVVVAAYALGVAASRLPDAYNVANSTPNVVYDLVLGGVLSAVFVPVLVGWIHKRDPGEGLRAAQVVMTTTVVLLSAMVVLGVVFSGLIIHLYTLQSHGPGTDAYRALASFFLKWFMPQILFYGVTTVATGYLNATGRFAAPMFVPILNNLIAIATFILFAVLRGSTRVGVATITATQRDLLAIGTTLGVVGMAAALWPFLRRAGFRWRWRVDPRHPALREVGRLAGWVVLYVVTNQAGYVILTVLANRVQGGFTAFAYAYLFFQLPYAILGVSIFTALLPPMSRAWSAGRLEEYRSLVTRGIGAASLVLVPATAGYVALAGPVIRLVLEHGGTRQADATLVAGVMAYMAWGLVFFSLFQLLARAFYAMRDSRTPTMVNLVATALNVALNFAFFPVLGVKGLALGQTLAFAFATVVMVVLLARRAGRLGGEGLGRSLAAALAGGAVAGVAALGAATALGKTVGTVAIGARLAQVAGGTAAGIAGLALVWAVARPPQIGAVVELVLRRAGRYRPRHAR